ncbi:hypothetical protein VM98_03035 [Streptomyces rubellomurinus subsp. indigoferus]|nr:hypothetical protein VM98_03035 [Streptomyces rubellomurinus subsp. indigoferus]
MDTEPYLPRLLLWLADEHSRRPGETASAAGFAAFEERPEAEVVELACTLESRGQVALSRNLAATAPEIILTAAGLAEARRLHTVRHDPVQRLRYARDAIVRWLFPLRHAGPVSIRDFLVSNGSVFLGDALAMAEVEEAVGYLVERRLVSASGQDHYVGGPVSITLTADGIDCATSGGSVTDHLSRTTAGPTINITNSQGVVVSSNNFTQNNTFGFNPAEVGQLASLANLVRQIGPTLGASPEQEAELIQGADVLHDEATTAAPDQGRLRRATDRVIAGLKAIPQATGALNMLIENASQAYQAVFGS